MNEVVNPELEKYSSWKASEKENYNDNKIQYLPKFPEFDHGDKNTQEYKKPDDKEKEKIYERLDLLGNLLKDASFDWRLDGAINISLIKGEPIRNHKDVDINILEGDLSKLEQLLSQKGYGIFHEDYKKDTKEFRYVERVNAAEISQMIKAKEINNLQIIKIDQDGKIIDKFEGDEYQDQNEKKILNFIDLHISRRNEPSGYIVDNAGISIPEKYFQPISRYKTQNGHEIPISHPVLVIYHKMWVARESDYKDIAYLRNYLKDEDKEFLYQTLQEGINNMLDKKRDDIKEIYQESIAQIKKDMSDEEIKEIISHNPLIKPMKEERKTNFLNYFIKQYKSVSDFGFEDFYRLATDFSIIEKVERLKTILK